MARNCRCRSSCRRVRADRSRRRWWHPDHRTAETILGGTDQRVTASSTAPPTTSSRAWPPRGWPMTTCLPNTATRVRRSRSSRRCRRSRCRRQDRDPRRPGFGGAIDRSGVPTEGISRLPGRDVEYASQRLWRQAAGGGRADARSCADVLPLSLRVQPTLVPTDHPLAG